LVGLSELKAIVWFDEANRVAIEKIDNLLIEIQFERAFVFTIERPSTKKEKRKVG
jgi:hypothetical protein